MACGKFQVPADLYWFPSESVLRFLTFYSLKLIHWEPTVESHGQRSLEGYSPMGCKESGRAEWLTMHALCLSFLIRIMGVRMVSVLWGRWRIKQLRVAKCWPLTWYRGSIHGPAALPQYSSLPVLAGPLGTSPLPTCDHPTLAVSLLLQGRKRGWPMWL